MPGLTLVFLFLILGILIYSYFTQPSPDIIPVIFFFAFVSLCGIFDYRKYHNKKLLLILGLFSLLLMWIIVYPYINQFNSTLISLLFNTVGIIGLMLQIIGEYLQEKAN